LLSSLKLIFVQSIGGYFEGKKAIRSASMATLCEGMKI
jgi:hypothetical protein